MDVSVLKMSFILVKLKELNLLDNDLNPVSYSVFKNRASIQKFGNQGRDQLKIVHVGLYKENLFGFYVNCAPYPQAMKEAYSWFLYLVKGEFERIDVQWGNSGMPLTYAGLRAANVPKKFLK